MTRRQIITSIKLKLKLYRISNIEVANKLVNRVGRPCTRQYVQGVLSGTIHARTDTLLRLNSVIDSIISDLDTKKKQLTTIKISN